MVASHDPHSAFNSQFYPLKYSWILDNATDVHVCNDIRRFRNFSRRDDYILTGNSTTGVKGFGNAYVDLKSPNGTQFRMGLPNTAYIPGFHTNLVSNPKIEDAGYYWDAKRNFIRKDFDDTPFAITPRSDNKLAVLEYHPNEAVMSANFVHRPSTKPNTSRGDIGVWHLRMGHPSKEVLEKPPAITNDIEITSDPSPVVAKSSGSPRAAPNCDACTQGKSTRQISRQPR